MDWHNRTNRAVFKWQKPHRKGVTLSCEDRKSTWNSGVRKAIRRDGFQKDSYQGEDKKGRHPPASLRFMGSRLHDEIGCRKVYARGVFERQKKSYDSKGDYWE